MTTTLSFGRDVQGFNAYAPFQADLKYSATLTTGNHATITIPSNNEKWLMGIVPTPGTSVWVSVGGTAALPVGGTFATTTSELNPPARTVLKAQVVDIITSSATTDISVVLYAIP